MSKMRKSKGIVESPETDPYLSGNLIYDIGGTAEQKREMEFSMKYSTLDLSQKAKKQSLKHSELTG